MQGFRKGFPPQSLDRGSTDNLQGNRQLSTAVLTDVQPIQWLLLLDKWKARMRNNGQDLPSPGNALVIATRDAKDYDTKFRVSCRNHRVQRIPRRVGHPKAC